MNLNEQLLININGEDFIVFFKDDGDPDYKMRWSGSVYPIYLSADKTWSFISNKSSDPEEDITKSTCWLHFSYCWRGVWEGRIYHKEEEFWCEDLKTISEMWCQLEKILKEKIKSDNPNYGHFDE